MKRGLSVFVLVAMCSISVFGQTKSAANPVTDAVRQLLERSSKNLLAAAEAMPQENYSFKPTPKQRSFGETISHTAESNSFLCSSISGMSAPAKLRPAVLGDDKSNAIAALKESFDFCREALGRVDDSHLGDQVDYFGNRKVSRAMALIGLTNDWADHYSALATCMRLKGLLPPTARSEGPQGGMKPLEKK